MDVNLGRVVIGLFAAFLAFGGIMGAASAGSRKSLIAGMGSALVSVLLLIASLWMPRIAFGMAALLAAVLAGFFIYRAQANRKPMPGLALGGISLFFAILLAWAALPGVGPELKPRPEVAPSQTT